jgi:hypothetical protein
MKRRRLAGPVLASALALVTTLTMAGGVLACSTADLSITAGTCSGYFSSATRTWTVTNTYTPQPIQWSVNSSFSGATTFASHAGGTVQTAATVNTLYVRFVNDPSVWISKTWDGGACPKPTPNISTSLSGGGQTGTSITVPIGTTVADTATVSYVAPSIVAAVPTPTGNVTFTVYTSNDCSTGAQAAGNPALSGGSATSNGIQFNQTGKYYWKAVYSGDDNYNTATSPCTAEVVIVTQNNPTIATTLSEATGVVGDSVHDSATLTGATSDAGGTVTYTVYTNNECTLGAIDAGTKSVTNGVVLDSDPITFSSVGTWYWQAVYSGDTNNSGAVSTCTSETLVIDATPYSSVGGETATPYSSVGGATGTPGTSLPPTNSGNDSSGNTAPLFALLICLAFGAVGLTAVEAQRRSIRR